MKLELKQYQQRTLDVVKAFFELTQTQSPKDAYEQVTADVDITTRLGALRRYVPNADSPDTPQVMIKIPTGGGKTILATQAIKVIATACNVEYPFVLWFTPSETIREQTAEALKKADDASVPTGTGRGVRREREGVRHRREVPDHARGHF